MDREQQRDMCANGGDDDSDSDEELTEKRDTSALLVWGCGEFGQHGHGHRDDVHCGDPESRWTVPKAMQLESKRVEQVACGASHTLVLLDDHSTVLSWGNGASGQLGIGEQVSSDLAQRVELHGELADARIVKVACGSRHSFLLTGGGQCISFGNNFNAQLGYDFRILRYKENQFLPHLVRTLHQHCVLDVACGSRHSAFLLAGGAVATAGNNHHGQLGHGNHQDMVTPTILEDLYDITAISSGSNHCAALTGEGKVYLWGYCKAVGAAEDLLIPVAKARRLKMAAITCGHSHTMALSAEGVVYTIGSGVNGELGRGEKSMWQTWFQPVDTSRIVDGRIVAMSAGECFNAVLTEKGRLLLWGCNVNHVISSCERVSFVFWRPTIADLGDFRGSISKISCGAWHIAAISGKPENPLPNLTRTPPETPVEQAHFINAAVLPIATDQGKDFDNIERPCSSSEELDEHERKSDEALMNRPEQGNMADKTARPESTGSRLFQGTRKTSASRRNTPSPVGCSCRPRSRSAPQRESLPKLAGREDGALPTVTETNAQKGLPWQMKNQPNPSIGQKTSVQSSKTRRSSANDFVLKSSPSLYKTARNTGFGVQHTAAIVPKGTLPPKPNTPETVQKPGDSPTLAKTKLSAQTLSSWKKSPQRLIGRQQYQYASLYRQSAPRADEHSQLNAKQQMNVQSRRKGPSRALVRSSTDSSLFTKSALLSGHTQRGLPVSLASASMVDTAFIASLTDGSPSKTPESSKLGLSQGQMVQSVVINDPIPTGASFKEQKDSKEDDGKLSSEVMEKAPAAALQRGQSKLHLTKVPFSSGGAWRSGKPANQPAQHHV